MGLPEDLDKLDSALRQLQVEWDKFFGGVERRPPSSLQSRVEGLVRQHANTEMRNSGDRFRYQSLQARFNSLNELWNKRLRALEEGRPLGLHGRAAVSAPVPAPAPAPAARAAATGAGGAGEVRVSDAGRDVQALRELFEAFARSRRETGEAAVKFEAFHKLVSQQAQRLIAEKGARAIDFRVETKDGKVSLKARPVK